MLHTYGTAFGLTLAAGLCTGIGSFLALLTRKTNTKFLSVSLGFSAGVMIYVSFVEILPEARLQLIETLGNRPGQWAALMSFFFGVTLAALIDKLVPQVENPHELHRVEELKDGLCMQERSKLMRMGTLTALAIGVHNFPEGIATFTAAVNDPHLGIAIAIAVAIHNIPEGIAVAVPIYYATCDMRKAFRLSFLSGLSEPIGALIGFLFLMPFLNQYLFGSIMAAVAGIMIFISFDELLPTAREYGESHLSIYGLMTGMFVMGVSVILFL